MQKLDYSQYNKWPIQVKSAHTFLREDIDNYK